MKKMKADNVKLKRPGRGSQYAAIFDQALTLKNESEVLVLPGPEDEDELPDAVNRLGAAFRGTTGPQPPKGYRWSVRSTEDGDVAVMLKTVKAK